MKTVFDGKTLKIVPEDGDLPICDNCNQEITGEAVVFYDNGIPIYVYCIGCKPEDPFKNEKLAHIKTLVEVSGREGYYICYKVTFK